MCPADPNQTSSHLKSRTDECTERVRAFAKQLNDLAVRLRRPEANAKSQVSLLSTLCDSLTQSTMLQSTAKVLAEEWERLSAVSFLRLESDLREICDKREWRLHGQWPDFVVNYGISVHIDESRHTIEVNDSIRVSLDELQGMLAKLSADLVPKSFSANSFLAKLASVYDRLAANGSQVPILDLYKELVIQSQSTRFWRNAAAHSFVPLSMSQFRARFSRMLDAPTLTVDGRALRLLPALNPKEAVFLYQPSERRFGYVGRIEFTLP
jgi:hypothetical protein